MNQILNRLKGVYGKVSSSETLLQEYYNDSQKEYEIIVALGSMVRIYTLWRYQTGSEKYHCKRYNVLK